MEEEKKLRGASGWQTKVRQTDWRLGEAIAFYLQQHRRTFEKNASILDIWSQAVPTFMQADCRPDKRVGNTLYVQVTPGAYMHQMQMLTGEVLEKIKQLSPRCGIQKIRLVPKITTD
ncbi:MAG: DUF721 domain-containing protein [Phycisphaerae bacterium]|nr:DUF721 domain-containing protein [Phycisphaerae bacterium]